MHLCSQMFQPALLQEGRRLDHTCMLSKHGRASVQLDFISTLSQPRDINMTNTTQILDLHIAESNANTSLRPQEEEEA